MLREPVLYLSGYLERHRQEYYDLMLAVSQTGEWTPWLDFFLRGVEESANESFDQVVALLTLRERWHAIFHRARSSALLLKLIDALFQTPAMTIAMAARTLDVTDAAASYNMKKLVDARIVTERTGRKWAQVFVAMDILEFIENPSARQTDGSA
jgi:Fic family protein